MEEGALAIDCSDSSLEDNRLNSDDGKDDENRRAVILPPPEEQANEVRDPAGGLLYEAGQTVDDDVDQVVLNEEAKGSDCSHATPELLRSPPRQCSNGVCNTAEDQKGCQSCLDKERRMRFLEERNQELERNYEELRNKLRKTHNCLRYLADETEANESCNQATDEGSNHVAYVKWSTGTASLNSPISVPRPAHPEAANLSTPRTPALKKESPTPVTPAPRHLPSPSMPPTGGQTSACKMDLATAQQYDLRPLIEGGCVYMSESLRTTFAESSGNSRKKLARKLARQLFSEDTLAASSVRGQTKPALDKAIVNDIIKYCMDPNTLIGAPAASSKDIVMSINALCGEACRRLQGSFTPSLSVPATPNASLPTPTSAAS